VALTQKGIIISKLVGLAVGAYVCVMMCAIAILIYHDPWTAVMIFTGALFGTIVGVTVLWVVNRQPSNKQTESTASKFGYPNQFALVVSAIPLGVGIVGGFVAVGELPAHQAAGVTIISLATGFALQFVLMWRLAVTLPKFFSLKRKGL
jgi:hypothetical protein